MRKNKFIILLISFMMIFQTVSVFADEPTGKTGDGGTTTPSIPPSQATTSTITHISASSTVVGKPGETKEIRAFVDFTYPLDEGGFPMFGQYFTISGSADTKGNNNIFMLKSSDERVPGRAYRGNMPGDSVDFQFTVQIANNAQPGTYPVDINVYTSDGQSKTVTTYVRVEYDPKQASRLILSDIRVIPHNTEIEPGEKVVVGFGIENPTENEINNVEVKLEGMSPEGFTLEKDFNAKNFDTILPGEEKRMSFILSAGPNAKAGNHEFKVTLSYFDPHIEGGQSKSEKSFFLTLKKDPSNVSSVVIENLVTPANTLYPGKSSTLSFDVTNKGKKAAKRVLIKSHVEGDGLVNKSISQQFIETLAPGETQSFSFTYLATPASSTQNYPITIKVEYRDEDQVEGDPLTTEQYSGIFVSNPKKDSTGDGKEDKISTPKVIIRKYTFNPKLPEAGKEFSMDLEFQNTSSTKVVKNIKISMNSPKGMDSKETAGSNIFTPVDSSNTFFIDKIMPNGVVQKTINLYTVPDATAKTYNVTCSFEYENGSNNQFKAEEEIGIPVVQSSRLEIGEVQTMESFNVGEGAPLSVTFYNTGKVTLYNMMVRFESEDLEAQNSTYYIGKFLEGSTENYDIQINAMEPGEKKGNIVFSYEDSTGKKQEVKKEVKYTVNEAPAFDPNAPENQMPIEEPGTKDKILNILKKWYLWVGLLAVGGITFFVVKKLKKKKETKDLTLDV